MNLARGILRIGLTGGIGAGKSTVARMLVQHGCHVIDADQISRQLTAKGGAAITSIERAFGSAMITSDGEMDRIKMRNLAFNNQEAKKTLEAILHPLIYDEIDRQGHLGMQSHARCVVFDLPLLVESPRWRKRLDHVVVIDCDPETQISRVKARSQLDRTQIQAIIAQQAPRPLRLQAADTVINNNSVSLEGLEQNITVFLDFVAPALETGNTGIASHTG